jgi:hypothetical protein
VPLVEAAMRGIVVTTDRYVRAPGRNLPCLYPEAATFYTFDCAHFVTESCTYIVALRLLTREYRQLIISLRYSESQTHRNNVRLFRRPVGQRLRFFCF